MLLCNSPSNSWVPNIEQTTCMLLIVVFPGSPPLSPPLALPVLSCCLGFPSFVAWGVGLHCSNLFCSNFRVYLVFTYSILAWAAQLLFCFEAVINIPLMFLDERRGQVEKGPNWISFVTSDGLPQCWLARAWRRQNLFKSGSVGLMAYCLLQRCRGSLLCGGTECTLREILVQGG